MLVISLTPIPVALVALTEQVRVSQDVLVSCWYSLFIGCDSVCSEAVAAAVQTAQAGSVEATSRECFLGSTTCDSPATGHSSLHIPRRTYTRFEGELSQV